MSKKNDDKGGNPKDQPVNHPDRKEVPPEPDDHQHPARDTREAPCPTQTASLSTNLSNCQTVVNRLLDRVRCCLEQGRSKRLAMTSSMSLISRAPAILVSQSNYSSASE